MLGREGGAVVKIRVIVTWYDCWVGVFVDRLRRCAYIFLVPRIGLMIEWSKAC